jgi:hypothetical protein
MNCRLRRSIDAARPGVNVLAAILTNFSKHRWISHKTSPITSIRIALLCVLAVAVPPGASGQQGTFVPTGSMNVSRGYQTATLLNNGKILIAGGYSGPGGPMVSSAELYDPATGQFSLTGNMTTPRSGHSATLLNDGKVLIAGGNGDSDAYSPPGSMQRLWPAGTAAELYDPATGAFTATGVMVYSRDFHTATLLNDGKVLLAGGQDCSGSGCPFPTAELYDPTTGTFASAGNMAGFTSPPGLRAALLNNGTVLFVGGLYGLGPTPAQLYDPATGMFTARLADTTFRTDPAATKLNNGVVLIAGADVSNTPASAELYDPVANTFTPTGSLINDRADHTGTLLDNGTVLIAGGAAVNVQVPNTPPTPPALASAELYDPTTGTFSATGTLITGRMDATATLLNNGTVLIAGGLTTSGENQNSPTLSSAELYEQVGTVPGSLSFSNQTIHTASASQTVTLTNNLSSALTISGVSTSGTDASDFSETSNCVGSLPAGASCAIEGIFTPSAVGARTATLTIANGISVSPMEIPLSGTGVPPAPVVSLSSTNVDFGTQTLGVSSAPQTVTLTNTGNANLIIQTISLGGANPADFVIATASTCKNGTTLVPNSSCAIQLTFLPTVLGSRTATVSIADNAADSPEMIALSGTAAPVPVVSVTPSNLSFPAQYVGTSGIPQSVTLTNNGSVALNITGVTASPSDFGLLNACGNTVAVAASCAIGVFFDPTAGGTRSGTLTIADNGAGGSQTVALTGIGQDFSMTPGSGASATVTAGETASYTISIAPAGGFAQSVSLACTGAPSSSTCSVSPSMISLNAKSAITATVTVTTTARSVGWRLSPGDRQIPLILVFAGTYLCLVFVLLQRRLHLQQVRFRWVPAFAVALLACLALSLTSCGGGSSGSGASGTQPGSYTITVTGNFTGGSTNLSHSTKLTLVVQ